MQCLLPFCQPQGLPISHPANAQTAQAANCFCTHHLPSHFHVCGVSLAWHALPCLRNSYPSFTVQLHHHLLCEAFPDFHHSNKSQYSQVCALRSPLGFCHIILKLILMFISTIRPDLLKGEDHPRLIHLCVAGYTQSRLSEGTDEATSTPPSSILFFF